MRGNMCQVQKYQKIYRFREILFNRQREKGSNGHAIQIQGVFSLRDKIGTCPNIEVGIDVTDKSPFFIRPYHVKVEHKNFIDKEMKHSCCLGILKEGF